MGNKDRFEELSEAEIALTKEKRAGYNSENQDVLGNFKRVAKICELYPGLDLKDPEVVGVVYALKQLDCYLNFLATGRDTPPENRASRLTDVSVYAKLLIMLHEDALREQEAEVKKPKDEPRTLDMFGEWDGEVFEITYYPFY